MPKIVDHAERRQEIAQAMWRVIARDGLPAASARSIAAEGGWSLGAVRHYFSSQDDLLLFATQMMVENVTARIGAEIERSRWQSALEQFLPLDDERSGEVRVWLAVLVRSHVDTTLGDLRVAGFEGSRHVCRLLVADLAGHAGSVELGRALPRALEPHAVSLHAWLDGLTLQAATVPELLPPDDVRREVRRRLRSLRTQLANAP